MLDDWNSQLTEAAEQPALQDLAAGGGGGTSGDRGDLFGLDHRAEYISRWGAQSTAACCSTRATLPRHACDTIVCPCVVQGPRPCRRLHRLC